jgi:hypothetical protein
MKERAPPGRYDAHILWPALAIEIQSPSDLKRFRTPPLVTCAFQDWNVAFAFVCAMRKVRRHFPQTAALESRLAFFAEDIRKKASQLPAGEEREALSNAFVKPKRRESGFCKSPTSKGGFLIDQQEPEATWNEAAHEHA